MSDEPGKEPPPTRGITRLAHSLTRHDDAFAGLVALALMALCVFSGTGTPLFVGVIAAGGGAAVLLLRFRKNRHPSLKDDEPEE